MPETAQIDGQAGDVLLLVGTMKGAFLLRSGDRRTWEIGGPHFPGEPVYSLGFDDRKGRRRVWAGCKSFFYGVTLRRSDDLGRTWSDPAHREPRFPEGTGELQNVWQILPGPDDDSLYVGVEPAALFVSHDAGETFSLARSLWDHPHRARWAPGAGGLCLHTILPQGRRTTVAVSSAGVYRSDDGGETWSARNQNIRAPFLPEGSQYPEFGQCVHKVALHPARPDRLYLQHHWGVYRSDDAGDTWTDIGKGKLPSDFGFALAVHPHEPDTVYIVPLESDGFRCTPGARMRVYRSQDAGESWHALERGLPQENAYETILRDNLALDTLRPAGVYVGTRSGKLYASSDDGDAWQAVAEGLPPVTCVKAAVLG